MQIKKTLGGAVLLELVFSLGIVLLISSLIFKQSYSSFRSALQTDWQATISVKTLKVAALLTRVMHDADSQRVLDYKIHPNGRIEFYNGQLLSLSGALAVESRSNAISVIEVDMQKMLRLKSENAVSKACLIHDNQFDANFYRSFLGITSNTAYEFVGSVSGTAKCKNFNLTGSLGILSAAPNNQDQSFLRFLIPIKRSYTLYVDKHKQLRFLATLGRRVLENQALISGISSLKIQRQVNAQGIKAVVEVNQQRIELKINNSLTRKSLYNFALNNL